MAAAGRAPSAWQTASGIALPLAVAAVVMGRVLIILSLLSFRLDSLGMPIVGGIGLFAALIAALVLPYLHSPSSLTQPVVRARWFTPLAAGVIALLLLGTAGARLSYSATYPRPDYLSYVLDARTGQASWQATSRDDYTSSVLVHASPATIQFGPFNEVTGLRAPAPPLALPAPTLVAERKNTSASNTTLQLRLLSPRKAGAIAADIHTSAAISAADIDGHPLPVSPEMRGGELKLLYVGLPSSGIHLTILTTGHGTLRATVSDYTQGLPAAAQPPQRPADTMPTARSFRADPTIVLNTVDINY